MRALQFEALESRFVLNGSSFSGSMFGQPAQRDGIAGFSHAPPPADDLPQARVPYSGRGDNSPRIEPGEERTFSTPIYQSIAPTDRGPKPDVSRRAVNDRHGEPINSRVIEPSHREPQLPGVDHGPPPNSDTSTAGSTVVSTGPSEQTPATEPPNEPTSPASPPEPLEVSVEHHFPQQDHDPRPPEHSDAITTASAPMTAPISLTRPPNQAPPESVPIEKPNPPIEVLDEDLPPRLPPVQTASKGAADQSLAERAPRSPQADTTTENVSSANARVLPKSAATLDRDPSSLNPAAQPVAAKAASPVDSSETRGPDSRAALSVSVAQATWPAPYDSFALQGDDARPMATAGSTTAPARPIRPNQNDESPATPEGIESGIPEEPRADARSYDAPRRLSAAALTNVLAVDVMALENAIDTFFQSIDRVGHDFVENRANMLYAAGMIGLAAAAAMEFSRRKSQAPTLSLAPQRGTSIPFTDEP